MKSRLTTTFMATCVLAIGAGCATTKPHGLQHKTPHTVAEVRGIVQSGPARLRALAKEVNATQQAFARLAKQSAPAWTRRGYLDASESDQMETLLYRFLATQGELSGWIAAFGGRQPEHLFPEQNLKSAAHILVVDAEFLLIGQRAEWVRQFSNDPLACAKLNEAFFRSHIPRDTFDDCRLSVVSSESLQRLEAAWVLFEQASRDSAIQQLVAGNPEYAHLLKQVAVDHRRARVALEHLPGASLTNRLAQSEAAAMARELGGKWDDLEYQSRALLFKNVSRLHSPFHSIIRFSPRQHAEVQQLLQPGDIILTYTAGVVSDIFIPGTFKHGMTYIGTPEQRKRAGVSAAYLPRQADPKKAALAQVVAKARLDDGRPADVIESVAEGVILNSLGRIMDTHVNRLTVLRPKLSPSERARFLTGVFSYYGAEYDFEFDFADASRQVCTELIYRSLNGLGGCTLSLSERGGHPTLTADDLVQYHFATAGRHFDVVLYAEEDFSRPGHQAVVFSGKASENKVREVMGLPAQPRQPTQPAQSAMPGVVQARGTTSPANFPPPGKPLGQPQPQDG